MTELEKNIKIYNDYCILLERHELDYIKRRKGSVYITAKLQLERQILQAKGRCEQMGKRHLIVKATFDIKVTISESIKQIMISKYQTQHLYYAGVTSEDALRLVVLQYPKAINIDCETIIPGSLQKVEGN